MDKEEDDFISIIVDEAVQREMIGPIEGLLEINAHLVTDNSIKFYIAIGINENRNKFIINTGNLVKLDKTKIDLNKYLSKNDIPETGIPVELVLEEAINDGIVKKDDKFKQKVLKEKLFSLFLSGLTVIATILPIFLARVLDEEPFQIICWIVFGVLMLIYAGKELGIHSISEFFTYLFGTGVVGFFIGLLLKNSTVQLVIAIVGSIFAIGNLIYRFKTIKKKYEN